MMGLVKLDSVPLPPTEMNYVFQVIASGRVFRFVNSVGVVCVNFRFSITKKCFDEASIALA